MTLTEEEVDKKIVEDWFKKNQLNLTEENIQDFKKTMTFELSKMQYYTKEIRKIISEVIFGKGIKK